MHTHTHTMEVMIQFNIMQIIWDQSNICNDVHVINLHQHSVTQRQLQCEECVVSEPLSIYCWHAASTQQVQRGVEPTVRGQVMDTVSVTDVTFLTSLKLTLNYGHILYLASV